VGKAEGCAGAIRVELGDVGPGFKVLVITPIVVELVVVDVLVVMSIIIKLVIVHVLVVDSLAISGREGTT